MDDLRRPDSGSVACAQAIRGNPAQRSSRSPYSTQADAPAGREAVRIAITVRRLMWLEPFWIAFLAPSILFPGRFWDRAWQPFLVALLFAFWPLRVFVRPMRLFRTPAGYAAAAMIVWLPVTVWVSAEPARSWEWVGYVALGIAAYAALVEWSPAADHPMLIAWGLISMGTGLALVGPLLVGAIPDKFALLYATRPAGAARLQALSETMNPNVLAGALVMILPLAAVSAGRAPSRTVAARAAAAFAALLMLSALIWTQSRGAYVAAIGSLGLAVLLSVPPRRRACFFAILAAVMAIAFFVLHDHGVRVASGLDRELARRVQIWQRAVLALHESPWAGIGFSQFDVVVPARYPYEFASGSPPSHAHNLFLQVGVDMGVPGLLFMLVIWIGTVAMLATMWRMETCASLVGQRTLCATVVAGASASLTAMLVHGLVDAVLWSSKLAFLPWLLYALVAATYVKHRDLVHRQPVRMD